MNVFKKHAHSIILNTSASIAVLVIIFFYSFSPSQKTLVSEVRALACSWVSGVDQSDCGGAVYDSCSCLGGDNSDICYVCIDSGGGDGSGGGSTCSPSCTDNSGNPITCGAWNTCYTEACGTPCDAGCPDVNNPNICPQAPTCPDGSLAPGGNTANCPAQVCTAPTSQTLDCPAGQTGSITQVKSDYPECAWVTTSNTCAASPTCTPVTGTSETLDCAPGETGSITRVMGSAPSCTWTETANSCTSIPGSCPAPSSQTLDCPAGQSGSITQVKSAYPSCTWVTTSNTCTPDCTPTTSCQVEGQTCGTLWNGCETISCGGTCPAGTANLGVSSNNISSSWTITPGGIAGSGLTGNFTVTPAASGTSYTITPSSIFGYDLAVTNSQGGGTIVSLTPNASATFFLNYTATPAGSFDFSLSGNTPISVTKSTTNVQASRTITITKISGTARPVALSIISSLPSGVTASFSNNPCTPTVSCAQTIVFTISQTADIVSGFPITIRATAN